MPEVGTGRWGPQAWGKGPTTEIIDSSNQDFLSNTVTKTSITCTFYINGTAFSGCPVGARRRRRTAEAIMNQTTSRSSVCEPQRLFAEILLGPARGRGGRAAATASPGTSPSDTSPSGGPAPREPGSFFPSGLCEEMKLPEANSLPCPLTQFLPPWNPSPGAILCSEAVNTILSAAEAKPLVNTYYAVFYK